MSLSIRQKQVIDYCSIPRTVQEIGNMRDSLVAFLNR